MSEATAKLAKVILSLKDLSRSDMTNLAHAIASDCCDALNAVDDELALLDVRLRDLEALVKKN